MGTEEHKAAKRFMENDKLRTQIKSKLQRRYSKTEKDKFHLFNDWGEWNQMDKIAHSFNCYFESKWHYDLYKWAGVKEKNAIWIGMLMGNAWQLSIEVNDGFQKKWC